MIYREQFEKETGMVAHYQDPDGDDSYTQFSYEYTEWLEKKLANKEHAIGLLKEQIKATEEKLQKAIECLGWYGDNANYDIRPDGYDDPVPAIPLVIEDQGIKATVCLKQITNETQNK